MLTPREKSPLQKNSPQRRIELMTLKQDSEPNTLHTSCSVPFFSFFVFFLSFCLVLYFVLFFLACSIMRCSACKNFDSHSHCMQVEIFLFSDCIHFVFVIVYKFFEKIKHVLVVVTLLSVAG